MTLATDFAALIAIAQAGELDAIKAKVLERVDEIGMAASRTLLVQVAARRVELAEARRKAETVGDAWEAADGTDA